MNYLKWDEKTIEDFSEKNITDMYGHGYVFTRLGKGLLHQTRSARIDLKKFNLSSENRRIIKKTQTINFEIIDLPMPDYDWSIGKMAKDFYDTKFGKGTLSAQKIKEILTDDSKSNFNTLLKVTAPSRGEPSPFVLLNQKSGDRLCSACPPKLEERRRAGAANVQGYAICYKNSSILHYSYPFYDIEKSPKDMGLGMMLKAIQYAQENHMQYIYLGSLQRPTDTYKLQFEGLEWFDGKTWSSDIEAVKKILTSDRM